MSFPNEAYEACNGTKHWQIHYEWTENCGRSNVEVQEHPKDLKETWITERTLYAFNGFANIGHFFSDNFWALYPESKWSTPSWALVWVPWTAVNMEECDSWICSRLNIFHQIAFGRPITENLLIIEDDVEMLCFEELLIPKFAMYRMGWWHMKGPYRFRNMNLKLRRSLTRDFQDPAHDILFYLHDDSGGHIDRSKSRRVWLNGEEIKKKLQNEESFQNIQIVHGFYGLLY